MFIRNIINKINRIYILFFSIMKNISPYHCPICKLNPSSHSFMKIFENEYIIYYYTCPSKAILYYDVESIINHYDGMLNECFKKYILILDGTDFSLIHALQINVASEVINLITRKYSHNLKEIIIINSGVFVSMIYNTIQPFLNEGIKNKIKFMDKYKTANEIILEKNPE